jgi:hypothetical protein
MFWYVLSIDLSSTNKESNQSKHLARLRSEGNLGNGLVKGLALDRGDLELQGRRLARAVAAGKRACSPRAASVDLGEVGELGKGTRVSERCNEIARSETDSEPRRRWFETNPRGTKLIPW